MLRTTDRRRRAGGAGLACGLALSGLLVWPADQTDSAPATDQTAVVRTDAGPVRGAVHDGYRSFQGIPFSAPPVGELRWQSPQPVEPWSEVLDATSPGDRCAQTAGIVIGNPASSSEDCLYLNVTTPASASRKAPKPVLVWLHGGALVWGAGSDYDANRLAVAGDVVVVTVNYRLGIFGFFGHPGLEGAGAQGLEDQQAALRWVQQNARAFGGDPGNVTLAGHSSGAGGVCANLASPSAAGLFHRVGFHGYPCTPDGTGDRPPAPLFDFQLALSPEQVNERGLASAAELGCDRAATAVACLRDIPAAELLELELPYFPLPGYGNRVLPENPEVVLRDGRFHRVPALSGITRDEGTLYTSLLFPEPLEPDEHRELLDEHFGDSADQVARAYPLDDYPTANQVWAAILTDRGDALSQQDTVRLLAARAPTYAFEFTDDTGPLMFEYPSTIDPGASHGTELYYLFDSTIRDDITLDHEQQRLAAQMIAYWSNFAEDGNPNGRGLPKWKRFKGNHPIPYVQGLGPGDGGIGRFDRVTAHRLDFWERLR